MPEKNGPKPCTKVQVSEVLPCKLGKFQCLYSNLHGYGFFVGFMGGGVCLGFFSKQ